MPTIKDDVAQALPALWAEHDKAITEQLADPRWAEGDDCDLVVVTMVYRRRAGQRILIGENTNGVATLRGTGGDSAALFHAGAAPDEQPTDVEQSSVPVLG